MPRKKASEGYEFGYWAVAFIDLLGQQDAFLRTDRLPDDESKRDAFMKEVAASVAVIQRLRQNLDQFRRAFKSKRVTKQSPFYRLSPAQRAKARELSTTSVRVHRASDGVALACPLKPGAGHAVPIHGVYDMLATSAAVMVLQLAQGRPIRAGIDVGTGIEVDGELFGAALVKSYQLESKHAKQPRVVVGKGLVEYLAKYTKAPGMAIEQQLERQLALGCLRFISKDTDGELIVDYAGDWAREQMGSPHDVFRAAYAFASRSREGYSANGNSAVDLSDLAEKEKLFARYSAVLRYLESRGVHELH